MEIDTVARRMKVAALLTPTADWSAIDAAARVADTRGFDAVGLSWEWDKWPAEPEAELESWQARGADRACVSLAGPDITERVTRLSAWLG